MHENNKKFSSKTHMPTFVSTKKNKNNIKQLLMYFQVKNFKKWPPWLIFYLVLISLILYHPPATSQRASKDKVRKSNLRLSSENGKCTNSISDLSSVTGRGKISFKLVLYEDISDDLTRLENQDVVCFSDCIALDHEDTNILPPPPSGQYPYGIWRCTIILDDERFRPEDYIVLEIKLPGEINPLNAKYCTQGFNIEEDIEWIELYNKSRQFFIDLDPDPNKRTLNVVLYDAVPLKRYDTGLGGNYFDPPVVGDIDQNQWIIEHIGGLMWPIPGKGRCFITNL